MQNQNKRPLPASLTTGLGLLARAVRMSLVRWQESLIALLIFIVVVGPVYAVAWSAPIEGIALLLAQPLLMATGYVAMMVAWIGMLYRESRASGATREACQARLLERWPGIRAEVLKTLALGASLMVSFKLSMYAMDPSTLGAAQQQTALLFYPVAGTALFAYVCHLHSCLHTPQLQLVARTTMNADERRAMAKLARQRYDNPVSLLLIVPIVIALVVVNVLPLATPLLWLLTFWYLEVSLYQLWLFKPKSCPSSE